MKRKYYKQFKYHRNTTIWNIIIIICEFILIFECLLNIVQLKNILMLHLFNNLRDGISSLDLHPKDSTR